MSPSIQSHFTQVEETNIHYLQAGKGETILFIHGWPTSSYLWRNVMAELADEYQVIAIDLPGFGQSDKRPEDSYSFRYHSKILIGFLDNLGIERITLGVHDLGGPIGLYWLVNHMDRVDRLILFNTLFYAPFSWAVKAFALATMLPGVRSWLSSPRGIRWAMRFGVHQKDRLTEEIIRNYQRPFPDKQSRQALLKSATRLSIKGFEEIAAKLPAFQKPVQILYGEKDRILPKVGETMQKVQATLPQAKVTSFPECGHFFQEEAPEQIGREIKAFLKAPQAS